MSNLFYDFLQGSFIVSLIALIILCFFPLISKRYRAKSHYYLWVFILLCLLFPFRPKILTIQLAVPVEQIPMNSISTVNTAENVNSEFQNETILSMETDKAGATKNFLSLLPELFPYIWLSGFLVFLLKKFVQYKCFLNNIKRYEKEAEKEQTYKFFDEIMSDMAIRGKVTIRICPIIATPISVGIIKPRILIPHEEYDEQKLAFVLTHELVHYKRKDALVNWMALFAVAINWFNPLVYLYCKITNLLCEISCDSEVLRRIGNSKRYLYGKALLEDDFSPTIKTYQFASGFSGKIKIMKLRLQSIMDPGNKKRGFLPLLFVLLLSFSLNSVIVQANNTAISEESEPQTSNSGYLDKTQSIANQDIFNDYSFVMDNSTTYGAWTYATRYTADSSPYAYDEYQKMIECFKLSAEKSLAADGEKTMWTKDKINRALMKFNTDLELIKSGEPVTDMVFEGIHFIPKAYIHRFIILSDGKNEYSFDTVIDGKMDVNKLKDNIISALKSHPLFEKLNYNLLQKIIY